MTEDKKNQSAEEPVTPTAEKAEKVEESEKNEKSEKPEKKEKRSVKVLEKQIETLKSEKEELNQTYLRMLAEYDNFRKRAQKEKDALYADGLAEAVEKLLPVLDNLERAMATPVNEPEAKAVLDGVQKILEQANDIFSKMGVTEIPAKDLPFDPELHNAVMHDESEDYGENIISDVFLKGYKLGDKVIRHSVVKVMN